MRKWQLQSSLEVVLEVHQNLEVKTESRSLSLGDRDYQITMSETISASLGTTTYFGSSCKPMMMRIKS